jgi:F0F1-type ATP synthase delta subunit
MIKEKKLIAKLQKKYNKTIILKEKIDKALIGGLYQDW